MILKLISSPELNFHESWYKGLKKVKLLPKFEKYMIFFWFLGPFIYLIERDPADFWLTSIVLIFLVRSFVKKDWDWFNQLWIKCAILFWLIGLFSSLFNPEPFYSFSQGFVWIRFPLYAVAAQTWLARDRDVRIMMLISILVGMSIMCCILLAEVYFEPKTRLTWPYGDTTPGGYIAKVSLPLFCALIAIAVSKRNTTSFFAGLIGLITISLSLLTGERVNFLIRACSGLLAGLVWKPKFLPYLILLIVEVLAVVVLLYARPDLGGRFISKFYASIPILNTTDSNPYWGAWRGGIQQITITPITGIGPSGTRKTCKDLSETSHTWLPGKNYCGNHPHNFYIQLFAETGIFGFLAGSMMIILIIKETYRIRKVYPECPLAATAFVVPFALFFPIQQFGSFFGQWGNLFIWFALGFAISQVQDWNKTNKKT